ncbi:ABC transporter permease [Deinococcus roseus]|uniref:ABC transporter permease n=1 Tax=Deinococcus roseus TaxID=392414 RepID=A0ABQ2D360_9DEIO|nr:ABC transporter permease [Deinococcus roseus]GGJ40136.1 ABC transporter permease [Deinococcus roseus]
MQRTAVARRKKATPIWVWQIVGVLFLLGSWYLFTSVLKLQPSYVMPTPEMVWEEYRYGFIKSDNPNDGQLIYAIGNSLRRVFTGYGIGIIIGVIIGVILSTNQILRAVVGGWLIALQSIPSIAYIPLAIIWFGLNEKAVLFVVVLEATLPVALALSGALLNVQPAVVTAGRNLGAVGLKVYTHVLLPASLPNIFTGIRVAWSFAWRALVGGELLSHAAGLGQLLETGRNVSNTALVLATMIIIGVVGVLFEQLIQRLENRVRSNYGLEVRK